MTTRLERLAVKLHDHMWLNIGVNDDWPLRLCGDDEAVDRLIELLNEMQDEIKRRELNTINYQPSPVGE